MCYYHNMYAVVVFALLVVAVAGQKYTTKFDNVNLDEILKNDRLLNSYYNCIMEKGKCTPDGEELKKNIPDALETDCSKCSERQKEGAERVLKFIYEKKPDMFKKLEAKYDTEGKYRTKYKKRAEDAGVKL